MSATKVWNRPGIGNVGSYQSSGIPWLTGSVVAAGQEVSFQFPYVAKRVQVQVLDASTGVEVHFLSTSSAGNVSGGLHMWQVEELYPADFQVKCKEVYVSHAYGGSAEVRVMAELTNIPAGEMFPLTGSGVDE